MNKYSITALYSGSKGNCVLIESGGARILIDAGKSARSLCAALTEIGKNIDNVDAIFLTHEHADHISALEVLLKKHRIPVHAVGQSAERMLARGFFTHTDLLISHPPVFSVAIGDMRINSFETPHDSAFSVGYRIEICGGDESVSIGYATDIGYVTQTLKDALCGCESVVIEANHDVKMLMEGTYPHDLKLRIRSNGGHLSNTECAELCAELSLVGTKNFLLAHLSEENNEPSLAFDEVWSAIADEEVNLKVAKQYEAVKLI